MRYLAALQYLAALHSSHTAALINQARHLCILRQRVVADADADAEPCVCVCVRAGVCVHACVRAPLTSVLPDGSVRYLYSVATHCAVCARARACVRVRVHVCECVCVVCAAYMDVISFHVRERSSAERCIARNSAKSDGKHSVNNRYK